jgi:tryptophanase
MDYLIEVLEAVWERRTGIAGVAITSAPAVLRHFRARFERVPSPAAARAGWA